MRGARDDRRARQVLLLHRHVDERSRLFAEDAVLGVLRHADHGHRPRRVRACRGRPTCCSSVLPSGILIGPHLPRRRFVDDHDRRRAVAIGVGEIASRHERHLHRREIAGRRRRSSRRRRSGGRASGGCDARHGEAAQAQAAASRAASSPTALADCTPGNVAHALDQLAARRRDRCRRCSREREIQRGQLDAARIEAGIDRRPPAAARARTVRRRRRARC